MTGPSDFPLGIFESPFRPAKFLNHPHVQTIFPRYHRKKPLTIDRIREKFPLPDGDEILLDHHTPSDLTDDVPITLIVHGLSGSSHSHYVIGLQLALSRMGWPSVAMNCRGAIEPNRLVRAYHAGAGDDIAHVGKHLISKFQRPLVIVGYSLGGCMTMHALKIWGDLPGLLASAVISVPWDFPKCADRMGTGFSRMYTRLILKELVEQFQTKANWLRANGNADGAELIESKLATGPFRDFWQFDDRVVAPLHGFADVQDYYAKCSPAPLLKDVRVPLLVIHAKDDPFMTPDVVPSDKDLSPKVRFELASNGGHVGLIAGSVRRPEYYLEKRIPEFLKWVWASAVG